MGNLGGVMKKLVLGLLILLFVSGLFAASLEDTLEDLSGNAVKSYVGPIVSAFGTNMNGGWFHKVPKKSIFGIDVEFGIVAMGTMFPDDDKHFDTTGNFSFTRDQAEELIEEGLYPPAVQNALIDKLISEEFEVGISGATIIGSEDDHVMIEFFGKEFDLEALGTFTVPGDSIDTGVGGYLDGVSALPMFAPQLGIGTVFGTKAYARFVPTMDLGELGDFSYWGFGLQHNVKAWIPVPLPIDVSLAAFTQKMKIGDYVEATATTMGVNAGKTLGMRFLSVTPYAGLMLESSKMEFTYNYVIGENPVTNEPMEQKINFEMEGDNNSRLILGAAVRLGVFNFSGDYNIGKYNSATASFGLAF